MSTATLYVEPEMTLERALEVIDKALACDSHFSVYSIGEDKVCPMLPLRQAVVTLRKGIVDANDLLVRVRAWLSCDHDDDLSIIEHDIRAYLSALEDGK